MKVIVGAWSVSACQAISGLDEYDIGTGGGPSSSSIASSTESSSGSSSTSEGSSTAAGGAGGGGGEGGGGCPPDLVDVDGEPGCEEPPVPLEGLVFWVEAGSFVDETDDHEAMWPDVVDDQRFFVPDDAPTSRAPMRQENAIAGRPAVKFDGMSTGLKTSVTLESSFAEGFTFAVVVRSETPDELDPVMDLQVGQRNVYVLGAPNVDKVFFGCPQNTDEEEGVFGACQTQEGAFGFGEDHLVVIVASDAGLVIRVDGADTVLTPPSIEKLPGAKSVTAYLGINVPDEDIARAYHEGIIAEAILYDRAIPEIDDIESYLLEKYFPPR